MCERERAHEKKNLICSINSPIARDSSCIISKGKEKTSVWTIKGTTRPCDKSPVSVQLCVRGVKKTARMRVLGAFTTYRIQLRWREGSIEVREQGSREFRCGKFGGTELRCATYTGLWATENFLFVFEICDSM
jgi:hypothetical protein